MRIAIVSPSFFPRVGGAEFVVHHLASAWARQGHDVLVVHPGAPGPEPPQLAYPVSRMSLLRGSTRFGYHRFPFAWWAKRSLAQVLNAFGPTFISAHFAYPCALWLTRMRGQPPILVTCHGRDITTAPWGFRTLFRIDRVLRDSLNNCRRVIAISRAARSLLEQLGVQPERIANVPNGVDLQRFQQRSTFDFRRALEIPPSACVVLSVGRDHTQKAFDTGLRAFALSTRARPDVYYVLLGRGTDRWSPLARELGIEPRVRFHEGLDSDHLVAAYQQSDIFMSSSRFELFSLALLEAIATGLPVVATNVSGNEDAIEPGRNGLLVEPDNPDVLAGGLTTLLEQPDLRHRMGEENRRRAPSYDWSEIARRYLEQL